MNFDSISESDPNVSKESSKSEDSEMQIIAETRGIHLEQINDNLQRENSKLRAQFNEATRSNAQIEELHKKIQELTLNITDLKTTNDDLSNRLSIALRANDELMTKYDEQKESLSEQRKSDVVSLRSEILRMQQQLNKESETHATIVHNLEMSNDKSIVELKSAQNILGRLKTAIEHYFETNFKEMEDIIHFLNQPPLKVHEVKENFQFANSRTQKDQQIVELNKQNKKLLDRLDEHKDQNQKLQEEIISIKKQHSIEIQEHIDSIEALKMKIAQRETEFTISSKEYQHKIEVLSSKLESMPMKASTITKSKSKQNETSPKQIVITQPSSQTNEDNDNCQCQQTNYRIIEFEDEIDDLKHKNEKLSGIIKEQNSTLAIISDKFKAEETAKEEAKRNFEKLSNDFNALKSLHQNSMIEINTLRTALHSKEDPEKISAQKEKIQKLKEKIGNLEASLQIKETELGKFKIDHNESIHNMENEKLSLINENERLRKEITSHQERIEVLKKDLEKKISSSNSDLMNQFNPFNPSINNQSLQQSLNDIRGAKQMKKKIAKYTTLNESLQREKDEISRSFDKFVASVSSLISPTPVSNPNDCIKLIETMANSVSALKRENELYHAAMLQLNCLFSFVKQNQSGTDCINSIQSRDSSCIISIINELTTIFQKQKQQLKKRKCQNSKLQTITNSLTDKVEAVQKHLTEKQEENEKLTETLRVMEEKVSRFKRKLHSQKLQIQNYGRLQEEGDFNSSRKANQMMTEKKQMEHSLRDKMIDMNAKISQYQDQIDALNDEIESLKKTNRTQKAKIVQLKLDIEKLENENVKNEDNLKNSHQSEKTVLETAIKDLQKELTNARADLEKMSKQFLCSQKKLKQMRFLVDSTKISKEGCEKEIDNLREQLDKEKEIAEANMKVQLLKAESDYKQKLDEQRGRWNNEKQQYFTYAAEQFRQFFNPQESIDERAFRDILRKARDEMLMMSASDTSIRKLVGADPRQKTEDAVAQIVMSVH